MTKPKSGPNAKIMSYETANRLAVEWPRAKNLRDAMRRAGIMVKDERKLYKLRREAEDLLGMQLPAHNVINAPRQYQNVREQTARYHLDHPYHAVIFSDAHFWPGHDTPAFWILLDIIQDLQPELVIDNGDSLDGATISRHPALDMGSLPSLEEEIENTQAHIEMIEEVAGEADLHRNLGNHDQRFEMKLAANASQFKGLPGFDFPSLFPKWDHSNSIMLNDEVFVKHRWHGGIHAGYNNAMKAGKSVVTGHTHKLGCSEWTDLNGTRFGIETGFISNIHSPAFEYVEDNPLNWREGFAVLHIDGDIVTPELVRVVNGQARWRGKVYGRKSSFVC